jgi:hypothetical protein
LATEPRNSLVKKSPSKQRSGSESAGTAIGITDLKALRQSFLVFTVAGDSIHETSFRGPSAPLSLLGSN